MQGISTFLWFDDQAEDAAQHYVSIFPDSAIGDVHRYNEASRGPAGQVMVVSFTLDGRPFQALNGGPRFAFTPAVSLVVSCDDQAEVDHYWDRLSDGGREEMCGWLVDRFGVSWQVVPTALGGLIGGPDPDGAARATESMLHMHKLDIAVLQHAYDGE